VFLATIPGLILSSFDFPEDFGIWN
jgi:hypothetical protein